MVRRLGAGDRHRFGNAFPIVVMPPTPPGSGLFLFGATFTVVMPDPARGCVCLAANGGLLFPYWGHGTRSLLDPPRLVLPDGSVMHDGDSHLFHGGAIVVERMPGEDRTLAAFGVDRCRLNQALEIFTDPARPRRPRATHAVHELT